MNRFDWSHKSERSHLVLPVDHLAIHRDAVDICGLDSLGYGVIKCPVGEIIRDVVLLSRNEFWIEVQGTELVHVVLLGRASRRSQVPVKV